MGIASRKHHEKKLHRKTIDFSNDEMILYELQKHVDYYTLQNLMLKVYFNETDLSMDSGTKIWMNLIHPCFYPNYHSHDYYEFNIIFEGKCIEIINNHVVNLEKGDILILPANSAYHTHYLKKDGHGC
ncbi:MAG: AraC family ligand binding domain-containing protein, partial [Clostridia bacterium]|nr:AraC family ligand binding domain-containing protein [Clostridia bacterium]